MIIIFSRKENLEVGGLAFYVYSTIPISTIISIIIILVQTAKNNFDINSLLKWKLSSSVWFRGYIPSLNLSRKCSN